MNEINEADGIPYLGSTFGHKLYIKYSLDQCSSPGRSSSGPRSDYLVNAWFMPMRRDDPLSATSYLKQPVARKQTSMRPQSFR
jgi:hypothetical protein